ncbi:MAG: oligopeptide:H+ symporter [Corynebacterium sp.]|uniref:peptide MFS transporter n=1 Tax=Corynebacterium sp. TaxID=1720 RepID=UPI0026DB1011|nr:oligopeptide:H+ symporter [Corynebacterium sp.]MDO5028988.1 oligopeptide:H+ symporter [Corynebacterium sp.]
MQKLEQRSSEAQEHPAARPQNPRVAIPALVGVETWERFSYYGMQAIMAYYLYDTAVHGGLGLSTSTATALMGAYGSLVYLSTIAGGWIGDRLLGAEKTLLAGAWLLVIGHLCLALIAGAPGVAIGLVLVALGSGSLKTSALTLLGHVRTPEDRRRDSDFQLFYFGINIGALAGPLLTGWLADRLGYHIGFGAAAILMIAGLTHYYLHRRGLHDGWDTATRLLAEHPTVPASRRTIGVLVAGILLVVATIVVAVASGVVELSSLATIMLVLTIATTAGLFATMLRDKSLTRAEHGRVLAFIPLFIVSVAFWAILNQTFGALAVYADVRVNREIGDFTVPAAWAQSLNPIFILLLSVPLALLRTKLAARMPQAPTQIVAGTALAGLGAWTLLLHTSTAAGSVPIGALVLAYGVITFGELHVGPVGMSTATALAPAKYATRFSALFFMTMAIGTALAGVMSTSYDPTNASSEQSYFLTVGGLALGLSLVAALFLPWINRKVS